WPAGPAIRPRPALFTAITPPHLPEFADNGRGGSPAATTAALKMPPDHVYFPKHCFRNTQHHPAPNEIAVDATTLLIDAASLLAGRATGALLTRAHAPQQKKQRELEEQLRSTSDAYRLYQQDVTEHFIKSSEHIRDIPQSYRALREQLA